MIRVENANDRFNIVITNLSWEAAEYLRAVLINAPDESNLALLEAMGVSIPECEVCENPAACEKPEVDMWREDTIAPIEFLAELLEVGLGGPCDCGSGDGDGDEIWGEV